MPVTVYLPGLDRLCVAHDDAHDAHVDPSGRLIVIDGDPGHAIATYAPPAWWSFEIETPTETKHDTDDPNDPTVGDLCEIDARQYFAGDHRPPGFPWADNPTASAMQGAQTAFRAGWFRGEAIGSRELTRLGEWIVEHIPGEPSRSEGVVDTTIRLLTNLTADLEQEQALVRDLDHLSGDAPEPRREGPTVVEALHRIDEIIGNRDTITPDELGGIRGLVLNALNVWHREGPQATLSEVLASVQEGDTRDPEDSLSDLVDRRVREMVDRGAPPFMVAVRAAALVGDNLPGLIERLEDLAGYSGQYRRLVSLLEARARDAHTANRAVEANLRLLADMTDARDAAVRRAEYAESEVTRLGYCPTLHIGDRVAVEDGDGKGVAGVVESWTTAPGGAPFVIVAGAEA